VFGLAAVGLAVPVLRIIGPAPEFFIAHDISPRGTAAFALVVGLAVPAAAATLGMVVGLIAAPLRAVVVAAVGAVAVAGALQPLSGLSLFYLLCVAAGIVLAHLEATDRTARTLMAVTGFIGLGVLLWFLAFSRSGEYIGSSAASDLGPVRSTAGPPETPVVLITFDEFPLSALLTSDLEINAARYPNFARLARESNWFPRAASVSPQTSWSVPAIWSGVAPETGALPVASQYPTNIFSVLGSAYEAHVNEPITALCSEQVCDGDAEPATADSSEDTAPDVLHDTLVVLGHGLGSESSRAQLPPITNGWAGFGGDTGRLLEAVSVDPGEDGEVANPGIGPGTYATQVAAATSWAEGCAAGGARPPLCVAHLLVPHGPHVANVDGSVYTSSGPPPGSEVVAGATAWSQDSALRSQAYQRLLLQIGATDRLLGQLIDTLEGRGVWDEAAVAVVADHGISYDPGPTRGSLSPEITRVPLFIKAPGQDAGEVREESALTIDAVPTVLGMIGVAPPEEMVGLDLNRDPVPDVREGGYLFVDRRETPDQSEAALADLVQERAAWVDPDGGWDEVYAAGPGGDLVGTGVAAAPLGEAGGNWSSTTPAPVAPAVGNVITVEVQPTSALTAVLGVLDGRVVAAAPGLPDAAAFTRVVIVDPAVATDLTSLRLYGLDSTGALRPLQRS
jgi:hypothetical protein